MVLIRVLALLALVACKQSLFAEPGGSPADAAVAVPATCPSPCVGDLAGDLGTTAHPWRYLEDHRHRTWTPMTLSGTTATGADAANTIAACTGGDAACGALPGAVLVSSSSASAAADPAVELKLIKNQVVTIDLAAYLPSGSSQTIRLYRNSREDALFTATLDPGAVLAHSMTIDGLAGDRLLVAVAPTAAGAKDVALQLFVSDTQMAFPQDCLLALSFPAITGTSVQDACKAAAFAYTNDTMSTPVSVFNVPAPYPELGSGVQIAADDFYQSTTVLDRHGDTTTQLWLQQTALVNDTAGWFFTDMDLDSGGGVGIDVGADADALPVVEAYSGTAAGQVAGITGSLSTDPHGWHFVRVTYTGGAMALCVDGTLVKSMPFPPLVTAYPVFMGKDHTWTPVGAFVNGSVDDIRVIKGALPCE